MNTSFTYGRRSVTLYSPNRPGWTKNFAAANIFGSTTDLMIVLSIKVNDRFFSRIMG
jgi:hypothetical protein